MEFASPFHGLLAVPVALILCLKVRSEWSRKKALRRLADPHLLPGLVPPEGNTSVLLRLLLPTAVMLLLVVALMRPQWGLIDEEHASSGADIVFALDLSRSMLADDASPSRLAAAKREICNFLNRCGGDRTGIIGFAGTAFLLCPLTSDREMVKSFVDEVEPRTLPKGGTSIASALREARTAFRGTAAGGRMLVVVSDGEDQTEDIADAMADLRKDGILIAAFGVGTPSGALMPLGAGSFVKDRRGAVVKTKADLQRLRLLDPSSSFIGDGAVMSRRLTALRATLRESSRKERRHRLAERYYLPLGAALLLSLLAFVLSRGRMEL